MLNVVDKWSTMILEVFIGFGNMKIISDFVKNNFK